MAARASGRLIPFQILKERAGRSVEVFEAATALQHLAHFIHDPAAIPDRPQRLEKNGRSQ